MPLSSKFYLNFIEIRWFQPVPGTSTATRVAQMESEFTAQLPVEGTRWLKKSATPCGEGQLRGRRIWGERPFVFTAPLLGQACWAKRQHFMCLESKLDPRGPGEAVKIISTQPVASGRCAEYVDEFFGLSWTACCTFHHFKFPMISNYGKFRWI